MVAAVLPRAFVWKRVHSLMGLWLVLFLMEHLLTNSQAALWLGDRGASFVRMVNALHNLPYLEVIECTLLGIPLVLHMILGIQYAYKSKGNAHKTNGSSPSLPQYNRNRAYSWQRITSWILLVLVIFHVVKFRFIDYPESVMTQEGIHYLVKVNKDPRLCTLAEQLHIRMYDNKAIEIEKKELKQRSRIISGKQTLSQAKDSYQLHQALVDKLIGMSVSSSQLILESKDFGAVTLMKVRETFQSPIYCIIYTIFVLATCFHAFNGLWTFIVSWGLVIRLVTQRAMLKWTIGLMVLIASLGLMAIWGSR